MVWYGMMQCNAIRDTQIRTKFILDLRGNLLAKDPVARPCAVDRGSGLLYRRRKVELTVVMTKTKGTSNSKEVL